MAAKKITEEVTTEEEVLVEENAVIIEEETEETLIEKKEDLVEELEVVEEKLEEIKEEKAKWPWPVLSSLWEEELIASLAKVDSSHIEKGAIKAIINGLIS